MFSQDKLAAVGLRPTTETDLYLTETEWKHFRIGDTMNVTLGAYADKKELAPGNLPYITRTASNNGVDG